MNNFKKNRAFTIAELVITTIIIAGIAMILMPVLIGDTKEQVTKASLNKTYTQLQQVNQSYSLLKARGKISYTGDPATTFFKVVKSVMKVVPSSKFAEYTTGYGPQLEGHVLAPSNVAGSENMIVLKNGSFIILDGPYIVADVNGIKSPNKIGKDIFYFEIGYNSFEGTLTIMPRRQAPGLGFVACDGVCDDYHNCLGCAATMLGVK